MNDKDTELFKDVVYVIQASSEERIRLAGRLDDDWKLDQTALEKVSWMEKYAGHVQTLQRSEL